MMSDIEMPLLAMRSQIGSGVNLVVQVSRLQDGSRKVTHITEVLGFDIESGRYRLQDIFLRDYQGFGPDGEIASELVPTGVIPECASQLREHGVELPRAVHEASERRKPGEPAT